MKNQENKLWKEQQESQEKVSGQQNGAKEKSELSPTWNSDALEELEDFIEEQGIYIRQ